MRVMEPIILSPLLFLIFFHLSATNACYEAEREVLLNFKSHLLDPSNRLSSWQGQNCCSWHGIRCSDSLHVTTLDLRNPNPERFIINKNSELVSTSDSNFTAITGTIPPSLFSLTHISYLDLSFNYFTFSKIQTGLANLTALTYLNLSNAMFSGSLTTQFSNLTSLWKFNNVRVLVLNGVNLSEVPLSPISNLWNPRTLQLSNCQISGRIPVKQLLNLTRLSYLKPTLEIIDLGFSGLTVNVDKHPFSSSFQPKLLSLDSCNLGGEIPIFISNLTQLNSLSLSNNSLSGRIPSWLLNLPNLGSLDLSLNNLRGALPTNIKLKSYFGSTTLRLGSNQLQGPIPSSLENVVEVDLSRNNFTGHIPTQLGLQNIKYLSLSGNKFSGEIPSSFCDANNQLMLLDLSNNSLRGTVPTSIGNCTSLIFLNLGGNNLSEQQKNWRVPKT
ncbi:hypothetical protein SLA2020_064370 [Shorea laevis]